MSTIIEEIRSGRNLKGILLLLCFYGVAYYFLYELAGIMHGLAEFSLWYPAAGVRFALIFLFGWRFGLLAIIPEVIAQGLMGQWERLYLDFWNALFGVGGPSIIYTAILVLMNRLRLLSNHLKELSEVVWFTVAAILAPALAAPIMTWNAVYNARMSSAEFVDAMMSFWVGDLVGVLMVAPVILLLVPAILTKQRAVLLQEIQTKSFAGEFLAALFFAWLLIDSMVTVSFPLRWLPLVLPFVVIGFRHGFAAVAFLTLLLNTLAVFPAQGLDLYGKFELQGFLAASSALGLILGGLVSAKRKDEHELSESFQIISQLERNRSAGDMAAQLIHELTQPLGAASIYTTGAIELHKQGKMSERELIEVLGKIQLQTSRTVEQINHHREFLKYGRTNKTNTSLQAIIEAVKPMIDIATAHADVVSEYVVPPRRLELCADSVQLQQAILNLVKNSIEAMEECAEKRITIEVGQTGDDCQYISVADTGPGFPVDFQVGTTTKPDGMGLGLKIVKQIVDGHGGTLILAQSSAKVILPCQ